MGGGSSLFLLTLFLAFASASPLYYGTFLDGNSTSGMGYSILKVDNTSLAFSISTFSTISSTATMAHIHKSNGAPGTTGPVIFPFTLDGSAFTFGSGTFTQEQYDALVSDLLYVNIHTSAFPAGEISGVLMLLSIADYIFFEGGFGDETPGAAVIKLDFAADTFETSIVTNFTSITRANFILEDNPFLDLSPSQALGWVVASSPATAISSSLILYLILGIKAIVVYPGGQVTSGLMEAIGEPRYFRASLNGSNENPPNTSPYTGLGNAMFDPEGFKLTIFTSTDHPDVRASHIHAGPPHLNGPVIFNIGSTGSSPNRKIKGTVTYSFSGVSATNLAYLISGLSYFNIHSDAFTAGEIRGQVGQRAGFPKVRVVVETSSKAFASSNGEISIVLKGKFGTSQSFVLGQGTSFATPTEIFLVVMPEVGPISSVELSNSRPNDRWTPKQVVVEGPSNDSPQIFAKQTPVGQPLEAFPPIQITVVTSANPGAGVARKVYLTLTDQAGKRLTLPLGNSLDAGSTRTFSISSNLGPLSSISLNNPSQDSWQFDSITIVHRGIPYGFGYSLPINKKSKTVVLNVV